MGTSSSLPVRRHARTEPKYPLLVWLPPDLRRALEASKRETRRSFTAIILDALRVSLTHAKRTAP